MKLPPNHHDPIQYVNTLFLKDSEVVVGISIDYWAKLNRHPLVELQAKRNEKKNNNK